jgi:hypothetical protein
MRPFHETDTKRTMMHKYYFILVTKFPQYSRVVHRLYIDQRSKMKRPQPWSAWDGTHNTTKRPRIQPRKRRREEPAEGEHTTAVDEFPMLTRQTYNRQEVVSLLRQMRAHAPPRVHRHPNYIS